MADRMHRMRCRLTQYTAACLCCVWTKDNRIQGLNIFNLPSPVEAPLWRRPIAGSISSSLSLHRMARFDKDTCAVVFFNLGLLGAHQF